MSTIMGPTEEKKMSWDTDRTAMKKRPSTDADLASSANRDDHGH